MTSGRVDAPWRLRVVRVRGGFRVFMESSVDGRWFALDRYEAVTSESGVIRAAYLGGFGLAEIGEAIELALLAS